MSFRNNRPASEGVPQQGAALQLPRRGASEPAFRPQLARSVRMHPVLAAVVTAVVLLALLGYALTQKNAYVAISQVYEEPATAKLLGDGSGGIFDANKYETFLGEQIQLVQRLDIVKAGLSSLPETTWAEFGKTLQDAAETVQTQMKVQRVATSYQLSISLKGSDPAKTAEIVNAITNAYLGQVRKSATAESDVRAQLLTEERQRIENELKTAQAEQTALGASIGVANPTGETGNPYDTELSGIRLQVSEARAAHDVAAAQLASLSGVGPSRTTGLSAAADEAIAGDAGLGSMKATISQRKATLSGQMAGMTPTNPVYKQDQDEMSDLDRTLEKMTVELRDKAARRLQDKLRTDLARTGDVEARLNGELARKTAQATSAAPRLQRAAEVASDIQRLGVREATLEDALRGLRMDTSAPAQVRLSLAATAPEHPEASRRKLFLLSALPLALLCGAFAAVLRRKQDTRIYGGLDMEDVVGFPPLAILPARSEVAERVYDEYVLRLAAGIENAYRTTGARMFLMTAVSLSTDIRPLASALTRKFREIGVNVLVATASEMLSPDVETVARSGAEPAVERELERLVEVPSEGFVAANAARMKREHGIVLVESEGLLHCAQTEYVARCVDATILVAECGVTTREELFQAAELLERMQVSGVGAVLEEVQLRFGTASFREAIEALERRHANAPARTRPERARGAQEAPDLQMSEFAEREQPPALQVPVQEEAAAEQVEEPADAAMPTRPFDRISDAWELPIFAQVPYVAGADSAGVMGEPVDTGAEPAVPAAGPKLVGHVVESEDASEEKETVTLRSDVAADGAREKIAAQVAEQEQEAVGGEAGMDRKTSWLKRLLGRDSAAVVSIVPQDDDEEDERYLREMPSSVAVGEPRGSSAGKMISAARTTTTHEEYEGPLASRLEQISRQRPAAAACRTTRLQIVPHEAAEEPEIAEEPVAEEAVPVLEVADLKTISAAEMPPEELQAAAEPELARVAGEEALSTLQVRETAVARVSSPRRPLSFHELTAMAAQQQATVDAEALPNFGAMSPGVAVEPERLTSAETVLAEPLAGALNTAGAEKLQDADVPLAPAASMTAVEAAPERVFDAEPVQQWPARSVESAQDSLDLADGVAEPVQAEVDDIEPVYAEASRHLTTGRWDPIPTLRPTVSGWRDRALHGTDRRWTGVDEEQPPPVPERRAAETNAIAAHRTEPLPAPMLTRQWGLLSKFQQARISSASIPIAKVEDDTERVTPGSGQGAGNRQD